MRLSWFTCTSLISASSLNRRHNRPIYVSHGSTVSHTRTSRLPHSDLLTSSSSQSSYYSSSSSNTDSYSYYDSASDFDSLEEQGTVSFYSVDPSESEYSLFSSDPSAEGSVISFLQRTLHAKRKEPVSKRAPTKRTSMKEPTRKNSKADKRPPIKAERISKKDQELRDGKETKLFKEFIQKRNSGKPEAAPQQRRVSINTNVPEPKKISKETEPDAGRVPTKEQTAKIQGPRRSQAGEQRQSSILRRTEAYGADPGVAPQQKPHYLYVSYHEVDNWSVVDDGRGMATNCHRNTHTSTRSSSSSSTSDPSTIASNQSYTIEFSSEHHRRFRRHISRSKTVSAPGAVSAVLKTNRQTTPK